jgi:hypothetical protein
MRHQNAAELLDDLNRVSRSIADAPTAVKTSNNNLWKTAFVALAGIALLSAALIWATSSKQTDPSTLQADSNSQPVQPLNPATGMNEQGLATIVPMSSEMMTNSNMTLTAPETLGGSDGNPYWQNGSVPPGAPQPVVPGGQVIDPNNPNSPFTQDDPRYLYDSNTGKYYMMVPTNPNANANTQATPTPKTTKSNSNTVIQPTIVPNETPKPQTSPTPDTKSTPAKTPVPKPTAQPKNSPSGKTQDSD